MYACRVAAVGSSPEIERFRLQVEGKVCPVSHSNVGLVLKLVDAVIQCLDFLQLYTIDLCDYQLCRF
jgi:hypothetical protein